MENNSTSILDEHRFILTDVTLEQTNDDTDSKNKFLVNPQLTIWYPEDGLGEVKWFPFVEVSVCRWKVEGFIEIIAEPGGIEITAMSGDGEDIAFFARLDNGKMRTAVRSFSGQSERMESCNEDRQMRLSWKVASGSPTATGMEDLPVGNSLATGISKPQQSTVKVNFEELRLIGRVSADNTVSPDSHVDPVALLARLGSLLLVRFERNGDFFDLAVALDLNRRAVNQTPNGHVDLPDRLALLGSSLRFRFEREGNASDITEAIAMHQRAVALIPDGHPNLPPKLTNLGNSFSSRFAWFGDLPDIAKAIAAHQRAVHLTPDGHTDLPLYLANWGCSISRRFQREGNYSDIVEAIWLHRRAVNLTPGGHPDLPSWLTNLGSSYDTLFQRSGNLPDITEAIAFYQKAIDLTPDSDANLPGLLGDLGSSYLHRFNRSGDLCDIYEAVATNQRAVDISPDDDANLPVSLTRLGSSLSELFERKGDISDINKAVLAHRRAIDHTPVGHPNFPLHLSNLGSSLTLRFDRGGHLPDISEAIAAYRRAGDLTPGGPSLPWYLTNLGNSLTLRFERDGKLPDIGGAIMAHRRAIELTPDDHAELPGMLINLGNSLKLSFERKGNLSDIGEAIAVNQRAVELTPDSHADLPAWLGNLGISLMRRFERRGDLSDIAKSIAAHQRAINLTPDGHARLPDRLINLGGSFLQRFQRKGDLPDIDEAIALNLKAVDLIPIGHSHLPSHLTNLGTSFLHRFECKGDLSDIDEAIVAHKKAVDLLPNDHADLSSPLSNLGNSYVCRFEGKGDIADIAEAILALRRAVDLTPAGHPCLPSHLTSLGNSLMHRFKHKCDVFDLFQAISLHQKSVDITPENGAHFPLHLESLAQSLYFRSIITKSSDDMEASIASYRSAASCNLGPPSVRSTAAERWALLSYQHHPDSPQTLVAFDTAVHLVSLIASLDDTLRYRYAHLKQDLSCFPLRAATAACSLGRPDKALEWLEQSRCLVWTQLSHLRTPLDTIRLHDEALAQRLSDVARDLENAGTSRRPSTIQMTMSAKILAQDEAQSHLELAKEWDELVQTVKSTVPGCENFLQPSPCSTLLRHLPDAGPIIIVNVYKDQCDAIVLRAGLDMPSSIHLSNFSHEKATEDRNKLVAILKQEGLRSRGHVKDDEPARGIRPIKGKGLDVDDLRNILADLWTCIVKPVLDGLGFSKLEPGSKTPPPRIWWCPTGPLSFLPLHAAGIYSDRSSESILDYAVSSYTPTVTSITERVKNDHPIEPHLSGLFLTSQPEVPGYPIIHNTTKEVTEIHEGAVERGVRSLKLEGTEATAEECLKHMEEFSSVHLACHGSQDENDPLKSRFLFHEGGLELSAINQKNIKNADLAFLSACQTSTGEETLAEEAVHLAAGMLAAGYRRVVATMWDINDAHALKVATDFYDYLWEHRDKASGGGFDGSLSAYALHYATRRLRGKLDSSRRSLLTWVPYVHFGF